MRPIKVLPFILTIMIAATSCGTSKMPGKSYNVDDLMVRIAEIKIDPNYLSEYIAILKEEAEASLKLEPGVISIFPMQIKDSPTQIRLVEIYASKDAYNKHILSPHFIKYKTSTSNMVKSLRLVDMEAVDKSTLGLIFTKLNN